MNEGRIVMAALALSMSISTGILFAISPVMLKAEEPKRFEYRIVEVLPDTMNMQTKLNEFGMNGWELVSVSMGNMTEPRLIFKK
jgi:hypothetical protein